MTWLPLYFRAATKEISLSLSFSDILFHWVLEAVSLGRNSQRFPGLSHFISPLTYWRMIHWSKKPKTIDWKSLAFLHISLSSSTLKIMSSRWKSCWMTLLPLMSIIALCSLASYSWYPLGWSCMIYRYKGWKSKNLHCWKSNRSQKHDACFETIKGKVFASSGEIESYR